jgi:site-specific recombinase XerD
MTKHVYNSFFDEETWKNVNQDNKNLMDDYLMELKQNKKAKTTIHQYHGDLRIIFLYICKFLNNKSILELNKKDFRRFSLWLTETNHVSAARHNRVMSCLRSLLSYAEQEDEYEYESNVARKVKGLPKDPVRTDENAFYMSFEQIIRIREELIRRGELQLAVLHMLMFDSGARRNEIAQVKKHGLLESNKTNVVVGKRGKRFPLVYLDDTKELIRRYLNERGEDKIDSLWTIGTSNLKREASYENLYDWVLRIRRIFSEIEGKELDIFPHSYRHSRCEVLLQGQDARILDKDGSPKKFTLEQVQTFLHHENPSTTQGYSKDHSEDMIDEMFDF